MFLDPEPRNSRRPHSQSDVSSYIRTAPAAPADQRIIRKPLQQKSSNSKIRPDVQDEAPLKPTVRLVRQSPSVASIKKELFGDTAKQRRLLLRNYEDWKLGKEVGETGFGVSEVPHLANESSNVDASIDDSWQESDVEANDLPSWKQRSLSSSDLSDSITLKGSSVAGFSYNHSAYSRSTRISSGTTLRDPYDSSVLHETDLEDLPESASEAGPSELTSPSLADLAVPDTPLRASIRTVQSSDSGDHASGHTVTPRPVSSRRNSWSSPLDSDVVISSSPPREPAFAPAIPPRISSKHHSVASFGSGSIRRTSVDLLRASPSRHLNTSPSHFVDTNPSQLDGSSSPVQSPATDVFASDLQSPDPSSLPFTSSPNFLAYGSSPTRPRSRSHPLRGEPSYESISLRIQDIHPTTLRSQRSWASIDPSSSLDTLPSIHVPRRRLRHRGALSLDVTDHSQSTEDMSADVAGYPSHDYSTPLSTLESSSYVTRNVALSRFSTASGVTASQGSTVWPEYNVRGQRVRSQSVDEYVSSSDEELGDITLASYREASAKPAPLFRPPVRTAEMHSMSKRYNGPLPPLPPEPQDSEEHLDRLAELNSPSLRPKRSGYSLRHQRSHSTPMHSRQVSMVSNNESDRWSTGSSIFPTWAWHFYSGNVALASMSMISLQPMPTPPTRDGAQNGMRFEKRYQRSITAPTTSTTKSPIGPRILPAIFRPRTRPLRKSIGAVRNLIRPSDRTPAPWTPVDAASPNPMAIEPASPSVMTQDTTQPPGHPRSGTIQDLDEESIAPPRPLPRAYSKQKHWNKMTFPRPMSKDRLGDFAPVPHLPSTQRSSQHIDAWRPPSFVDSIDLIFKSRGHRQILFFLLGFLCPLIWMVGAVMPLPKRPAGPSWDPSKITSQWLEENTAAGAAGPGMDSDVARAWREEKAWRQGMWWRNVNRVMSVLGLLIIGAVIAIALVATR